MGVAMNLNLQVHWASRLVSGNRIFRKQKNGPRILCEGYYWSNARTPEQAIAAHLRLFPHDVVKMVLPRSKAL
jgi:hypothetical protein